MTLARAARLCLIMPFGVIAATVATPEKFEVYGYSSNFGGLPMFFADSYAYVGDFREMNSTDAAIVTFTRGANNDLVGSPSNMTNGTSPSWSDVLLTIPTSDSTDKRVGFSEAGNTSDSSMTTGFVFYGATMMHKSSTGQLESSFTALRIARRVWALYWNDTSSGQEQIVMRSTPPSNTPVPMPVV